MSVAGIAQLGERETEDSKVSSSIPSRGILSRPLGMDSQERARFQIHTSQMARIKFEHVQVASSEVDSSAFSYPRQSSL